MISCSYSRRRASLWSSLILGLFLIFFALEAYLRVLMVSVKLNELGPIEEIIRVFVLPPRESYKSLVSILSLYGIWVDLSDVRLEITWHKVERLKLILVISLNRAPLEPALDALSLPARSTRFNFPSLNLMTLAPSSTWSLNCSTVT